MGSVRLLTWTHDLCMSHQRSAFFCERPQGMTQQQGWTNWSGFSLDEKLYKVGLSRSRFFDHPRQLPNQTDSHGTFIHIQKSQSPAREMMEKGVFRMVEAAPVRSRTLLSIVWQAGARPEAKVRVNSQHVFVYGF